VTEYKPQEIEKKWQKFWDQNKTFKTPESPARKKFYCLDMFPYPSGSGLHIGHPLGYTATDIFSRYKRMQGFDVLHPMGYDAFGLPAEQHAVSTGEHPGKITTENCKNFTEQMKGIGFSYDWDRELATCTPDYYRWTQWIFLRLFNSWFDEETSKARPIEELPIPENVKARGEKAIADYQADHRLAYLAEAMVNWCPALGTVLANEEVIDGLSERGGHEVVRKPMKQWMLRITKYADRLLEELEGVDWPESIKEQQRNWIGKRFGAEIHFKVDGLDQELVAFTTRPDTLFGVTFFVIPPEHPMVSQITTPEQKDKVNAYCEAAFKMSEFDRTLDNRKKTGVYTGGHVINPITQELVPVYVGDYVLMSYGTGAVMGVPAHDERDFEFARLFQIDIRPVLIPETADQSLLIAVQDGEIPWTEPGVMLPCEASVAKELHLVNMDNKAAGKEIVKWLEQRSMGREVVNYKLRDWLFSRQRYWGEPIPIIHWEDGRSTALTDQELPLLLPEVEDYKPSDGGESPLARAKDWLMVYDEKRKLRGRRETNTMPQWAGSCWYYLRFIDPHNDSESWNQDLENKWMNVDLYVGGAEHAVLHLLYSRFWHKVLFDLGHVSTREPFQKLFNQGMILSHAYKNGRGALVAVDEVMLDAEGQAVHKISGEELERIVAKMSKSLRNVINPDQVIEEFGADTLRMYLMFMGPLDQSRIWDSQAINGNFRFLKRVWSYVSDYIEATSKFVEPSQETSNTKRVIHSTIKRVSDDLEAMRFNTAIAALMECLNGINTQPLSKQSLESFVLLLAPFAPHMAEELWQKLGHTSSLSYEKWPRYDSELLELSSVTVVIQVNGKKRSTIEVPAEVSEQQLQASIIQHMQDTSFPVSATDRFITVRQQPKNHPKLVNVILG